MRRRRLFSLDSWEQTTYVWANDNPGNAFSNNSRFRPEANASFANLNVTADNIAGVLVLSLEAVQSDGVPTNPNLPSAPNPLRGWPVATPSLAHRDRKINLNFPLPVSNLPDEPIRVKWIRETYELLKAILPPRAVDTPLGAGAVEPIRDQCRRLSRLRRHDDSVRKPRRLGHRPSQPSQAASR